MGSFFPRLHSPQWIVSVWHYTRAVLEKGLKRFFSQFHMCLLLRLLCASNQTLEYFIFFAILLVEFLMHLVIFVKRQKSRPSFKKVASYSCAQTFLSSHKTFSLQKKIPDCGSWLLVVVFLLTRTAQLFVSRRVPRLSWRWDYLKQDASLTIGYKGNWAGI